MTNVAPLLCAFNDLNRTGKGWCYWLSGNKPAPSTGISSLAIAENVRVKICYDDQKTKCRFLWREYRLTAGSPLDNLAIISFDDQIKNFLVETGEIESMKPIACFFMDPVFKGDADCVFSPQEDHSNVVRNDAFSSLQFYKAGYTIKTWNDGLNKGKEGMFSDNRENLNDDGYNDVISAYQTFLGIPTS